MTTARRRSVAVRRVPYAPRRNFPRPLIRECDYNCRAYIRAARVCAWDEGWMVLGDEWKRRRVGVSLFSFRAAWGEGVFFIFRLLATNKDVYASRDGLFCTRDAHAALHFVNYYVFCVVQEGGGRRRSSISFRLKCTEKPLTLCESAPYGYGLLRGYCAVQVCCINVASQ